MKKIIEQFGIQLKGVDKETHSLEAIFSTADMDRHGDIVHQNWDLEHFNQNPVILNSHNYSDATETVGKAVNTRIENGKLVGKIVFAVAENPKAKVIFDLYAGGFLNAFSVGFMPLDFNEKGEIIRSSLLEVSAVSVPANAYALAKQKGIDVGALENKDYEQSTEEDDGGAAPDHDEDKGGEGSSESECPHCQGERKVSGEGQKGDESEQEVQENVEQDDADGSEDEEEEGRSDGKGETEDDTGTEEDSEDAEETTENAGNGTVEAEVETEEVEDQPQPPAKRLTAEERRAKTFRQFATLVDEYTREITRSKHVSEEDVRAERRRQINKAIRQLTKLKKIV